MTPELTREEVAELLEYDPNTGVFTWKAITSNRVKAGIRAGTVNGRGYRLIGVNGKQVPAHRLAFLFMTGKWPAKYVDHINGQRDDNRFPNLRDVTQTVNMQNQKKARQDSKTGLLGVTLKKGRFRATIKVNGKQRSLGTFSTPEVAHAVYLSHKRKAHPGNTL